MGKLTLGDLGLIHPRKEHICGCKNMYGGCGCVVRDYNQAVDLFNKITVEEVIERANKINELKSQEIMKETLEEEKA